MESNGLQKKFYIFLAVVASVTFVLIFIPSIEEWLRQIIFSQFNLKIDADDNIISTIGGKPSQLATVLLGFMVNAFRIVRIFLLMTIIVSIVKFITDVIYGAALKNSNEFFIF